MCIHFLLIIPLEENLSLFYNQNDIVDVLSKHEFKILVPLAMKLSYFLFNEMLCKETNGVVMCSPLESTLANGFLCFYEKNWLEQCHDKFKPVCYRRYVDVTFVLFKSQDYLTKLRVYLNKSNSSRIFLSSKKENLPFLDAEVSRKKKQICY